MMSKSANMTLSQLNYEKMLLRIPAMALTATIIAVGTVGNLVTCYVYGFRLPLNTNSCFVVALAACDFLTNVLFLPFDILLGIFPVMFSDTYACKVMQYGYFVTTALSATILFLIALNRYILLCWPRNRQITVKVAQVLSVTMGCAALLCMSPVLHIYGLVPVTTDDVNGTYCGVPEEYGSYFRFYFTGLVILLAGCISGTLVCYYLIWRRIRHRLFSVRRKSARGTLGVCERAIPETATAGDDKPTKTKRINTTMFIVVVVFVASYLPTVTVVIIRSFTDFRKSLSPAGEAFVELCLCSLFLSSALNPFIYGYRDKNYTDQVKLLASLCCKHK